MNWKRFYRFLYFCTHLSSCLLLRQRRRTLSGGEQPTTCDTVGVTYATKILPLLQTKCYVCHSSGAALGGIILEDYANAAQYALNGKLYGAINHNTGFSPMPQGGAKLPACDIAIVKNGWMMAHPIIRNANYFILLTNKITYED